MRTQSSAAIIVGIATLVAVSVVSWLLGVDLWLAVVIAIICAVSAQFVTDRQSRP